MAGQRIKNTSCFAFGDDGTVDAAGWSRMLVAVGGEQAGWCSEISGNTD